MLLSVIPLSSSSASIYSKGSDGDYPSVKRSSTAMIKSNVNSGKAYIILKEILFAFQKC